MRNSVRFGLGVALLALVACGAPVVSEPPVRGLAAETAGVDADGNPIQSEGGAPTEPEVDGDENAQAVAAADTDQNAPEAVPVTATAPRRGLFGALFGGDRVPEPATAPVDGDEDGPTVAEAETTAEIAPEEVAVAAAPPRQGFFGGLFGGGRASDPATNAPTPLGAANAAPGPSRAPDGQVAKGTVLPFGQVATVCGLSASDLGKPVDKFPRDGRARWNLHDPIPASTGPRTHYITGFRDRCARQVTGALVLFGNADVHETTRYAATNTRAYTATDTAYEQIKTRLCGVRKGVPCPADRYDRLSKAVNFVTVYSRFGTTDEWYELLLVNGELEAAAMSGL